MKEKYENKIKKINIPGTYKIFLVICKFKFISKNWLVQKVEICIFKIIT